MNIWNPVAPSSDAASSTSTGIALIAADSTTIAKPVCTQIMMTISRNVFSGGLSSQFGGFFTPSHTTTWESRPICG